MDPQDDKKLDDPLHSDEVQKSPNGNPQGIEQVTLTILANAGEGIFFLNREYEIHQYYSSALETI